MNTIKTLIIGLSLAALTGCFPQKGHVLTKVSEFTTEADILAVFPPKEFLTQTTREYFEQHKLEVENLPGEPIVLQVWLKNGFLYHYEYKEPAS